MRLLTQTLGHPDRMRKCLAIVVPLLVATLLPLTVGLVANPRVPPAAAATVPPLEPLPSTWSAPDPGFFRSVYAPQDPFAWSTGTPSAPHVTLVGQRRLTQRDLATGAVRWQRDLDAPVCLTAGRPDGDVGVLVVGDDGDCRRIVAIDLGTGRLRWQRTIPENRLYAGVGVDAEGGVVTMVGYDEALSFDTEDGHPVGSRREGRPGPTGRCYDDYSVGRGLLITVRSCGSSDDPDRPTPIITAIDTASGREVARRTLAEGGDPMTVVSRSPLVVAVRQGASGALFNLDGGGAPGSAALPLGRLARDPASEVFARMIDGLLVTKYPGLSALISIDPETGREVTRQPIVDGAVVFGVREGRVLMVAGGGLMSNGPGSALLLSADPTGRTLTEALGTMDASGFALATVGPEVAVLGDRLITRPSDPDRDATVALALPETGRPLPATDDALPWAPGDIRPGDVADVRNHVAAEALDTLGIDAPALPPADGSYQQFGDSDDDYDLRSLNTLVAVQTPTTTESTSLIDPEQGVKPVSAVQSAKNLMRNTRADRSDAREVYDLGEEAFLAAGDDDDADEDGDDSQLLLYARRANVVVMVQVYVAHAEVGQPYLRQGARAVAEDLLEQVERATAG